MRPAPRRRASAAIRTPKAAAGSKVIRYDDERGSRTGRPFSSVVVWVKQQHSLTSRVLAVPSSALPSRPWVSAAITGTPVPSTQMYSMSGAGPAAGRGTTWRAVVAAAPAAVTAAAPPPAGPAPPRPPPPRPRDPAPAPPRAGPRRPGPGRPPGPAGLPPRTPPARADRRAPFLPLRLRGLAGGRRYRPGLADRLAHLRDLLGQRREPLIVLQLGPHLAQLLRPQLTADRAPARHRARPQPPRPVAPAARLGAAPA